MPEFQIIGQNDTIKTIGRVNLLEFRRLPLN